MWRTPLGIRVLTGGEAALFRQGLCTLVCYTEHGEAIGGRWDTGVAVFDALTTPERLAVLEQVGRALLPATGRRAPCPPPAAVSEGAVAAVFYQIKNEIADEIEERWKGWRRLVRAACRELGSTEGLPRASSRDQAVWWEVVEWLVDQVLTGRHWEAEQVPLDLSPEAARAARARAGVPRDYYTAVPPDPPPARLRQIRQSLRCLTGVP